ncbi:Aurofusarin cluster transcription factor aurR2 [Hyphodiscus hymeniophilus]|uniref:Aurofusarin cluster transcription factor aurR2 n=1 Tax=Hyphodiscus hymeniophilus TaxID=353542 RepID=A0A9P7AUG2_9HELO|nr:Aurofusarin cluster transcription factor aurR2 [Hyphodiscus hymeniophilus]
MSSKEAAQVPPLGQRKHPCVLCQQRKVKCDRSEPCQNCVKAGVECISAATLPPRKRKRRFPEAELLARIRRYEHHLKAYGADLDAINREIGVEGPSIPSNSAIKSNHSSPPVGSRPISPDPASRPLSVRRSLRHVDNNLNLGISDEFRDAEDLLGGSSDDETFSKPMTKAFEELSSDIGGDGDLFFGTNTAITLKALHPPPVQIFRLWQTFLDNVNVGVIQPLHLSSILPPRWRDTFYNPGCAQLSLKLTILLLSSRINANFKSLQPLIKIFHAPSVQQQILDAIADLDNVPKNIQALMFCIYAAATMSMNDEECQKIFNQRKDEVLARFQLGARQALRIGGYLRSSDLVVLQALTLYLFSSLQMTIDPRTLFCLTGVAVRIAQRMGLSSDGSQYELPPFETEMRRRLWWQIVLIDTRVSELSGAGTSVLTYTWTTRLPSNVNDSDLFPDMRDPPVERPGLTEMVFVRLRCEGRQLVEDSREGSRAFVGSQPSLIDEFEQRLDREYLSHCDPLIPLHAMSIMMAKSFLCKLRMGLRHPYFMSVRSNGLSAVEKDTLFQLSLTMLENHNAAMRNPAIQRFIWYIYTNFPFPAHVYLLCALRWRTSDEFAERAWEELGESGEKRLLNDDFKTYAKRKLTFIHMALAKMTIKAWNAREAAFQNSPQALPIPRFVSVYRKQLAEVKAGKEPKWWDKTNDSSPISFEDQQHPDQMVPQFPPLDANAPGMGQSFNQNMPLGTLPWSIESQLLLHPSYPPDMRTGWEFWNNMMQGGDSMQGIDAIPPPYNFQN